MTEPIYLTIQSNGTVVVQTHAYAVAGGSAYSIQVLNAPLKPLPSTGGMGSTPLYLLGLLLMAAATGGALLPRRRRGGGAP